MGLVSTWLSGIGLSHAIPSFKAAGIVTPAALAELDVTHYEALGVTEAADRRKLFYLVQRIKMAVEKDDDESITQEVDSVLSQSLNSSKLVLTEDDSLGDDDDDEYREPPKKEPERRKSRRVTSAGSRRTTDSKVATTEEMKENREQNRSSRRSSLSGQRSLPSRGRATRTSSKRSVTKEESEESEDNASDDSDWNHDQESSISADDELSQKPVAPSRRRTSRRLQEKKVQQDSDVSFESSTQDESNAETASRRKARTAAKETNGHSSRRQSSGSTSTRRRSTSSKTESDDDSSSLSSSSARKSSIPMHRGRRYESKIQNPGASARTGKILSSIPSDSVAPMSPLVDIPKARLDADILRQQQLEEKKAAVSAARKSSLTRSRAATSGSDSESQSSRRRRSTATSGSESESSTSRRRSGLTRQRSAGSDVTKRRRSLGGVPVRSMPQKSSSLRELNTHEASDKMDAKGRRSLPAGVKPLNSSTDAAPKGPVFVHGAVEDNSWGAQVDKLRSDNQAEHELFAGHYLEPDDEEMRIRVIIRKRPMSNSEASSGKEIDVIHPLEYDGYGRVLVYQPKTRVDLTKEIETIPFAFDNVFDETSNNIQIYERSVRNLVPGVFEGRWASCFAYGQTGSGKTFTMMGSNLTGINAGNASIDKENLGLYYMAALDVFELASRPEYSHISVGASLFEIYGGKLFDLLNDRKPVKCLENHRGKVCFPGLSEHPVSNANELMDVIEAGAANRSTGCTSKNADSSRSHAVLQLSLRKDTGRQKNVEHGRLTFIDLAGSERGADTSKASRATRLEGAEINTSLLALKEVIRALATGDSMAHIPFRGSKLTQVLKESFVGKNSRSVMVACIAPNISNCEHTLNTLRYADRVKERNPETGNLSATVAGTTSKSRRLSRSSSVPVAMGTSSAPASISNDVDEESFPASIAGSDDPGTTDFDDDSETRSIVDSDTDLLDSLLKTPKPAETAESNGGHVPRTVESERSSGSRRNREKPLENLISTHRSVMTEMLGMVKDEMTLVNKADADRDTVDHYMEELENLHRRQVSLIATLEDRLKEYCEARIGSGPSRTPATAAFSMMSDDDSFEDLRD